MFPQEILDEQRFLQHLWDKYRLGLSCIDGKFEASGQVQYIGKDGWSVLTFDNRRKTYDVFFLGRSIEEAQQHITRVFLN
jgi:hypothetical protein